MDTNPDPKTLAQALAARTSVVSIFVEKTRVDGTAFDGTGSGFIIKKRGDKGIVITCQHVLRGDLGWKRKKDKIFVRGMSSEPGTPWQAQGHLIKQHSFADLAIIEVNGLPKTVQELKFVASDELPVGTPAIAVGCSNPEDVFCESDDIIITSVPAVSPGAICGPIMVSTGDGIVREEIPISCETETGFSGCPAICSTGVIGVIGSGLEQISLAISTETVNRVLKLWRGIKDGENKSIEDMIDMFRI